MIEFMGRVRGSAAARRCPPVDSVRTRLLDAARGLLDEGGRDRLQVRRIAERAGVSATAMYHHFPDKAAMLGALAAEGFGQLRLVFEAAGREGASLEDLCGIQARFAHRNEPLYRLMCDLRDNAPTPGIVMAEAAAFAALHVAVTRALSAGRPACDTQDLAQGLWAFGHGVAIRTIRSPSGCQPRAQFVAGSAARWLQALSRAGEAVATPRT